MQKRKIGLIAAGLVFASSALVVGQSKQVSRLKGHGSLSTGTNRYQVSITTSEGKITLVQPPHTQLYYEAWSLAPAPTNKPLVRSLYCEGEATLVMTQYGRRIMSMTINKARVDIENLPK
jgi:type IV secretory pathway protease TraF